jgi:VWFA-related protein
VWAAPGQKSDICHLDFREGETLVVENDFGRIRVLAWEHPRLESRIRIIAAEAERLQNVTVACATSQRTHFVRVGYFDYSAESVYLDILLPSRAHLVVWGANPAVEVTGLGGQVRVQTLTGRITAENLTGSVSLQTQDGSVVFRAGLQPESDIHLGSVNGEIRCHVLRGVNLRGWMRAGGRIAWNGEVELARGFLEKQVGVGGPLLAATSENGSIEFRIEAALAPVTPQSEIRPSATPTPEFLDLGNPRPTEPASAAGGEDAGTTATIPSPLKSPDHSRHDPLPGGFAVKVNVDWVYVNASVRDRRTGRAVPGLTRDQFELREDGVLQSIEKFASTEAPFTLVLLLDVSGSTKSFLDMVKEAAIDFTRRIQPDDRVAVVTFNSRTRLRQDFTNDREAVVEAIRRIRSGGGTAFYDALYQVVEDLLPGIEGRQAVVVFSDGVDNRLTGDYSNGSQTSFRDLYHRIQEGEALIYTIFLDSEAEFGKHAGHRRSPGGILGDIILGRGGLGGLGDRGDPAYQEAREQLQMIADQTGGRLYMPTSAGQLAGVFTEIAGDLRVQYTIGYASNNPKRDGSWRELQVRVKDRPDLEVRARRGYYAAREPSPGPSPSIPAGGGRTSP